MSLSWENGKKPSFGTDFDPFKPKFEPLLFKPLLQTIIGCNFKWVRTFQSFKHDGYNSQEMFFN